MGTEERIFQNLSFKTGKTPQWVLRTGRSPPKRMITDMYEKLPQELKERGAFCLWKYEERDGNRTKVPYQTNGLRADSANKATFTNYAIAVRHRAGYDGIGIGVFGDICAIDIDKRLGITLPARSDGHSPYGWDDTTITQIFTRQEYLGHTVNFKTRTKSFRDKKKLANDPSEWAVFENTHDAIIDQESFDIVQRIREGRRRVTPMGEMPILSGMLFCADCG